MKFNIAPKHYVVSLLGFILAIYIFFVNYSLGNPISRCIFISIWTFLLWLGCWLLYFEIRDIWNNRWVPNQIETFGIKIKPLYIPIPSGKKPKSSFLYGEWLTARNSSQHTPVIIFTHGFSDSSQKIRHYLLPLVYAGYDVVSYDNRGTARSRKAGSKNQFTKIVFDLEHIIRDITLKSSDRPIYLVGISLGSMAAIYQGLRHYHQNIKKVITLATIANFQYALPSSPILFKKDWWVWIRYKFFGVPINPLPEENRILSPLIQIQTMKEKFQRDSKLDTFLT